MSPNPPLNVRALLPAKIRHRYRDKMQRVQVAVNQQILDIPSRAGHALKLEDQRSVVQHDARLAPCRTRSRVLSHARSSRKAGALECSSLPCDLRESGS